MVLFSVLSLIKPATKTNVEIIDDAFIIIDNQQDKMSAGVFLIGALVFASNYINKELL
jgi:hypothetical protein